MKRLLVVVGAGTVLIGVLATMASAHTKTYSTSSTLIREEQPTAPFTPPQTIFSGKVSSSNPKCVGGRTVDIVIDGGLLATVKADGAGNWRTGPLISDGSEAVSVRQKALRKNKKHKHICKSSALQR